MMGLDILTNNTPAPQSDSPEPSSSSGSAFVSPWNNPTKNKQQNQTTYDLEARPGFHGSSQFGAVAGSSGSSEVPLLLQQEEGELTDVLDRFLQSFEQHIDNCSAREKEETGGESLTKTCQPDTVPSKCRKTKTQTLSPHLHNTHRLQSAELQQSDNAGTQLSRAQTCKAAGRRAGKARAPTKPQKKRRTSQFMFSLEINKKSVSLTDLKSRISSDQDKQLQQRAVVTLERSLSLPASVTLQELCESREAKVT